MATKKIRVYELARELGVDNQVVLDLAGELRIGIKSHSSSIEDPQADRVRRLCDTKGLRGEPIVEAKPEKVEKVTKVKKATKQAAPVLEPEVAPIAPSNAQPQEGEAPAHRVVRSSGGAPASASTSAPAPAPLAPAPTTPMAAAPTTPMAAAPVPSALPTAPTSDGDIVSHPVERPAASVSPSAPPAVPRSATGRPIPPPPGGGRVIPPPPGRRIVPGSGRPADGGRSAGGARDGGRGAGARDAGRGAGGRDDAGRGRNDNAGRGRGGEGGGFRGGPSATFRVPTPGAGAPPPPGGGRGAPGAGRGRPPGQQRRGKKKRRRVQEFEPQAAPVFTPREAPVPEGEIVITRGITIQELAPKLNRTAADLVRLLFDAGEMVTATQSLADEMVELIGEELGAEVLLVDPGQEAELELQAMFGDDDDEEEEDEALLEAHAPVVTVMGHVDHGKTTLLDRIRSANVVAGEAGGITQHIGAYQVMHNGRPITFIDTPGHEAFTAMRARGAQATDVVVLVVAANDGVMPQTIEAIHHARAAEVPIVVAVTKIDREDADPSRARQGLVEQELVPEEWGGQTIVNDVAATTGQGIEELLESILLVSDIEELVANPKAPARAFVLESNLDSGRGPVVTALVERGTLRVGDPIVAGGAWGRVRAMFDAAGNQVQEAGPSVPVEVLGLSDVPLAGDELRVAPDERVARTVADARARRRRAAALRQTMTVTSGARLEDVFAMVQRGEVAALNLVLKADVQGSLEALTEALRKVDAEHDEVRLAFVHRGVGGITESDINLASVSNATVIGFNVRPDKKARELAEGQHVEVRLYEIIYKALEEVNAALLGMLSPEFEEVVTGEAEVREIFGVPKVGKIAGCYVRDGVITRGSKVRFLREGTIIWKGSIASLRRFKEDAKEVREGFECGIGLENFQDLKPGDLIETYVVREVERKS